MSKSKIGGIFLMEKVPHLSRRDKLYCRLLNFTFINPVYTILIKVVKNVDTLC